MTEHVEGDPCKFALWSGRTPSSDNKTVLKVSLFCLLSLLLELVVQALGALNERLISSLLIFMWLPCLSVGSHLRQEQFSSKASMWITILQLCCLAEIASLFATWAEQLHTDTGHIVGCLARNCNSLSPLPLGLATINLVLKPPELTAMSVKWISSEEFVL